MIMIRQNCKAYGLNSKIMTINSNLMINNFGDIEIIDVNKGENWTLRRIA